MGWFDSQLHAWWPTDLALRERYQAFRTAIRLSATPEDEFLAGSWPRGERHAFLLARAPAP